MAKKIVAFGELMLKLSPLGYNRFLQSDTFKVEYSGAEANVAVSLASFSETVSFVTKLPSHEIGSAALNCIRQYGIETDFIVRGDDRLGIYFAEKGASQRPSKVIYDRQHSAFSEADLHDFDWNCIFNNAQWFHFTGITPALSDTMAAICLEACKVAKSKGLTVSCDLNYRSKLWSKEKACSVMSELMPYIDVCIANESDAADVFGIKASDSDVDNGIVERKSYCQVAEKLVDRFHFSIVAITLRESVSANDNNWSAILYDGGKKYMSRKYAMHVVDRIGGGDAFCAGLIYGMVNNYDLQHSLDFAVATSCLKHSVEGDFNLVSVAEVEALISSSGSGRIQR